MLDDKNELRAWYRDTSNGGAFPPGTWKLHPGSVGGKFDPATAISSSTLDARGGRAYLTYRSEELNTTWVAVVPWEGSGEALKFQEPVLTSVKVMEGSKLAGAYVERYEGLDGKHGDYNLAFWQNYGNDISGMVVRENGDWGAVPGVPIGSIPE